MTVDECTRRWKSLRDEFVRENKKSEEKKDRGEGTMLRCWPLYIVMLFIGDTVKLFFSLCCNSLVKMLFKL